MFYNNNNNNRKYAFYLFFEYIINYMSYTGPLKIIDFCRQSINTIQTLRNVVLRNVQ